MTLFVADGPLALASYETDTPEDPEGDGTDGDHGGDEETAVGVW